MALTQTVLLRSMAWQSFGKQRYARGTMSDQRDDDNQGDHVDKAFPEGSGLGLTLRSETTPKLSEKWAKHGIMRHGMSHAGVTLWEWNLKTGELRIDSLADGHPFHYALPSPTVWERIVHEEDRDRLLEALRTFESTSYLAFDCFFRLATDEPRWVHARDMHLETTKHGNPKAVVGLFFDATESEIAKEQLLWGREFCGEPDDKGQIRLIRVLSERRRHERDASRTANLMDQCYHEFMSLFPSATFPRSEKTSI
jgi:hypothetical protein